MYSKDSQRNGGDGTGPEVSLASTIRTTQLLVNDAERAVAQYHHYVHTKDPVTPFSDADSFPDSASITIGLMYPPTPLLHICECCKLCRSLTECGLQAARGEGDSVLALHLFDVGEGPVKKLVSLVP